MATSSLYLDTRRPLKDGTFPLKVNVTHDRIPRLFRTKYSFLKAEYEAILSGKRLTEEQKIKRQVLAAIENRVSEIIESIETNGSFSFDLFKLRWTGKGSRNDIIIRLQDLKKECIENSRYGTVGIVSSAISAIKRFTGRESVLLREITPDWLRKFEVHCRSEGNSSSTIAIHMARIKHIINTAIDQGEYDAKNYPFGKRYTPPSSKNNKRALSEDDISKLFSFRTDIPYLQEAIDYWMFSYLSGGMNLVDIYELKWSNFNGMASFTFQRRKTIKTLKEPLFITIHLTNLHREIIKRQGTDHKSEYVFPVFNSRMTPKEKHYARQTTHLRINRNLKAIAGSLGIEIKVTSIFARHSYATKLMKTAPLVYIKQQLGHNKISTTENYLGSFTPEEGAVYEADLIPK